MRTATEIRAELDALRSIDSAYNAVANERGDGYRREDPRIAPLAAEMMTAVAAEFASVWTLETLAARRAAWNAEVAPLVAARKPVSAAVVKKIEASLGYTLADIAKAKQLHNIA